MAAPCSTAIPSPRITQALILRSVGGLLSSRLPGEGTRRTSGPAATRVEPVPETHGRRRGALRGLLTEAGVDALLVTDLLNIRYLTGFTGSNAAVLLHADGDGKTLFCTDGRYTTQSAGEVPDLDKVVDRASAAALVAKVAKDPKTYGRVGFESHHVSVEDYEALAKEVPLKRTPGLV